MKNLLIFLILVGFVVSPVFAENLFYGKASFDLVPDFLIPQKPEIFEIKFQYTDQPYVLQNLTAIIETSPKDASNHVSIDLEPTETHPGFLARIPVTIMVDEKITSEKIFLSISYTGIGLHDVPFKSAWTDSLILDILPKNSQESFFGDCNPFDLKTEITEGAVLETCHTTNSNSVKAIVNSFSNSTLSIHIPKSMIYSLTTTDCLTTNEFLVLQNGEEIIAEIKESENLNIVSIDSISGISEIEILGTVIVPNPSPGQYCGIVEGYDTQYLPPHKQKKNGMGIEFIKCNDGLVFVQKNDGSPSCVKPETKERLIERGWAKINCQKANSLKN